MPSPNGIEIRAAAPQDDLQEMLGHPPGWIMHFGISAIGLVISIGLLLSWLIRYPDELPAAAVLEQHRPPHELRSLGSGRIDTILYKDRARVSKDKPIIILESAANWKHVEQLLRGLREVPAGLPSLDAPLELGSLQNAWASYGQAAKDWNNFRQRSIFQERQHAIEQEIRSLHELSSAYRAQKAVFEEEQALVQSEMERTDALHREGVRSTYEWEQQRVRVLQYARQLKALEVTLLQNEVQIQQLITQLANLKDEFLQSRNTLQRALEQTRKQLIGSLEEWQAQNLLRSAVSGQLELQPDVQPRAVVQAGAHLGTVVPEGYSEETITVNLFLPAAGIGKIDVGAPVRISLDAYPEAEFGQLTAQITSIDEAPQSQEDGSWAYGAKANLQDALRTNYGIALPATARLTGQAVVITEDRRILERVFEQFLDLVKN